MFVSSHCNVGLSASLDVRIDMHPPPILPICIGPVGAGLLARCISEGRPKERVCMMPGTTCPHATTCSTGLAPPHVLKKCTCPASEARTSFGAKFALRFCQCDGTLQWITSNELPPHDVARTSFRDPLLHKLLQWSATDLI